MKRLLRQLRYGQRGFTLIELLIVIAILGIIAVVVIPNVGGFMKTGNLATANTEVAAVKTASVAYYADDGDFPTTSASFAPYLNKPPKSTYHFTEVGIVDAIPADGWAVEGFTFDVPTQQWKKT
ncbi:Type II secretion system protein G [subsurface metagenome]